MATINMPNQARLSYTFNGTTNNILSNTTNTERVDQYTMAVTKDAVSDSIPRGGNAAYVIRLENTGAGTLYNPTITDNLAPAADGGANQLSYIADSARFYVNGSEIAGNAAAGANNVTFTAAQPLAPGDNFIVVYSASADNAAAGTLTNTATATVNSGSAAGPQITAEDDAAVNLISTANVSILKSADKASVMSGDTLTYTFTLLNTGSAPTDAVTISDELPAEFSVQSVSYTTGGTTTPVEASDYSITAPNTLTIPAAASSLVIPVPAATADGPGITTVTVSGTIS